MCSDYNECVHRVGDYKSGEEEMKMMMKMTMMPNPLMHREGVSTSVGGLGSSMLVIPASSFLKPPGYLKKSKNRPF